MRAIASCLQRAAGNGIHWQHPQSPFWSGAKVRSWRQTAAPFRIQAALAQGIGRAANDGGGHVLFFNAGVWNSLSCRAIVKAEGDAVTLRFADQET